MTQPAANTRDTPGARAYACQKRWRARRRIGAVLVQVSVTPWQRQTLKALGLLEEGADDVALRRV